MRTAIESIQSGVSSKDHPFYSVRDELAITPYHLSLQGTILVMPKALRNETLHHAYKGNQGVVKTKQAPTLESLVA